MNKVKEILHYPLLLIFAGLILITTVLDLATPAKSFSEMENRYLAQRPEMTIRSLMAQDEDQKYSIQYEEYTNDQFIGRDGWITLKSIAESALGKIENNGIAYGDDHYMFAKMQYFSDLQNRQYPRNISFIQQMAEKYPQMKIAFGIIPNSYAVLWEKVPFGLENINQEAGIAEIYQGITAPNVEKLYFLPLLQEHRDEYIYYRTDHHWTTLGAYYAYSRLCETLGLVPFDREAHTAVEVPDFYGTFYSRARTWNAQPDTLTYYELDNPLTIYTVTGPGMPTQGEAAGLYDLDKLAVYDKYAAFLHGNNGFSRVEGDGEGRILVIKDSYANSLVPFLTANYAQIDVVDLRNYNYGLDALIAENGYDQILVLYSFDSFKSDPYLYRAGIEG